MDKNTKKLVEKNARHAANMDVPMPQDIVTTKWQNGVYTGYLKGYNDAVESVIESLESNVNDYIFKDSYAGTVEFKVSAKLFDDLRNKLKYVSDDIALNDKLSGKAEVNAYLDYLAELFDNGDDFANELRTGAFDFLVHQHKEGIWTDADEDVNIVKSELIGMIYDNLPMLKLYFPAIKKRSDVAKVIDLKRYKLA